MNRSEAQAILPTLTAFAEGKDIQFFNDHAFEWEGTVTPGFNPGIRYRVKPTPVLRPWTRAECPAIFIGKEKLTGRHYIMRKAPETYQSLVTIETAYGERCCMAVSCLEFYVQVHPDGTESPCGVMEEAS